MLSILLATATASDGKSMHMMKPDHLRAPEFQVEEKMDDLAALAEIEAHEAGELIAWPGHFPHWPFPWPSVTFPHHQDTKAEEPAAVPEKDEAAVLADIGADEAGEAIGILCSIVPMLCGGGLPLPLGRRRASVPEISPEFRVVEDVASLMAKLEGEDKMLVAQVMQDQATMLHSVGEHEAGEIIGGLLCNIPFVGQILCGGQTQPTMGLPGGLGRRRANWETISAKHTMAKDVKTLVTKLDGEDKQLVAKLFVDEAKMLQAVGQDEAGEGFLTAALVALIGAAPGIVTSIVNAVKR